ncbi:MAG: PxKF domain-containing protein [Chloroflexota bacterium]
MSTSVVASFVQTKIACDNGLTIDEIEVNSTGGTSLRYDTTGGQFIQNWQTPKAAGSCYKVTMTNHDGSFLTAFFKLK